MKKIDPKDFVMGADPTTMEPGERCIQRSSCFPTFALLQKRRSCENDVQREK